MMIVPRRMLEKVKALLGIKPTPNTAGAVRVPRLSHVVGRRHTYYWPGRRAAAALRTAGKTRRMR